MAREKSPKIALVDYGAGNLRSVAKALERSNLTPVVTSDPSVVHSADGVLLPGVGAFRDAAQARADVGHVDQLRGDLAGSLSDLACSGGVWKRA